MEQPQIHSQNETLLQGIEKGNPKVIRYIYTKYFDSIAQYILKNNGSMEDAQDVFQDAMMIMYEKTKQPNFSLGYSLHTYLFSIARNIWLKKLRKNVEKGVPFTGNLVLIDGGSFEEEIIWRNKERLYREKFMELGEGCQKVLKLFLSGASMEQIAEALDLSSPSYAKKRKYQCKKKLLKLIKNDIRYKDLKE